MPQLSLYIDDPTLRKVRKAARTSHLSVSRWISNKVRESAKATWPEGFFDLAGSVTDTTFVRPRQPPSSFDSKRAVL